MKISSQIVRSDAYLFWIILQVINEVVEGPASIYVILSTLKVVSLHQDVPLNEPKMYSLHRYCVSALETFGRSGISLVLHRPKLSLQEIILGSQPGIICELW